MTEPATPADSGNDAATVAAEAASTRHLNVLLGFMLLALHGAIAWGATEWWQRSLMLAHFGLFLMWQPVWRGERQVPLTLALLVAGMGALFALAGNWWLIATWIALLFSLIGGGLPGTRGRGDRLVAMLAAVYLLAMLLAWVVPQLFTRYNMPAELTYLVRYGLPALLLLILVIPRRERRRADPAIIDLFYSVMLFLLVVVLALGSFVIQEITHGQYLLGVAQVLMVIALVLIGLSWMWNPHGGFSGLGTLLSRYLLGLGLPFEQRMRRLAEMAESETRPEEFLRAALTSLLDLPWVGGYAWITAYSSGEVGRRKGEFTEDYETASLKVSVRAERPLSPAMLLHMKLLMQIVGHFYEAQRREQLRQQSAYTRAIYETGARLTHDVKNLLQSLRSICAAAEMRGADDTAFRALVQRQLPHITQRLGATLDKLKSPAPATAASEVDAAIWWQGLQTRYAGRAVVFDLPEPATDQRIPAELFDSVADTLIENALYKAARDGSVHIIVELFRGPRLRVCDDGKPVPEGMTGNLMQAPVPSESGLGVGLYQAATFAASCGYALQLAENRRGRVCFELVRD